MLPADSPRPLDGRQKGEKTAADGQPYIRESPIILMIDLLTRHDSADETCGSIISNRGTPLFDAYLQYIRGNFDASRALDARFLYVKHKFPQSVNALRDSGGVDAENVHVVGFCPISPSRLSLKRTWKACMR